MASCCLNASKSSVAFVTGLDVGHTVCISNNLTQQKHKAKSKKGKASHRTCCLLPVYVDMVIMASTLESEIAV